MIQKKTKEAAAAPARKSADLRGPVEELREVGAEPFLGDELVEEARAVGLDLSERDLPGLSVKMSVLERVSFAGTEISAPFLQDVRLVRCDFSNATWRKFQATRVEFVECRLIGMKALECNWQDVLLRDCDGRYLQLTDGRLRSCEFRESNFTEADLRSVDFSSTLVGQLDLTRADLRGARLRNLDLRDSEIEGMLVAPEDVKGAVVSAPQAMELARLLGLVIR